MAEVKRSGEVRKGWQHNFQCNAEYVLASLASSQDIFYGLVAISITIYEMANILQGNESFYFYLYFSHIENL